MIPVRIQSRHYCCIYGTKAAACYGMFFGESIAPGGGGRGGAVVLTVIVVVLLVVVAMLVLVFQVFSLSFFCTASFGLSVCLLARGLTRLLARSLARLLAFSPSFSRFLLNCPLTVITASPVIRGPPA